MALHAREALNRLVAALERHLELAENVDVVQEAVMESAEDAVRDSFFTYDDVLFTNYGVELPFEIIDDDFDDDDDDDDYDSDGPSTLIDDDEIEIVDIDTDEEMSFD